jgi:hypothetical protein
MVIDWGEKVILHVTKLIGGYQFFFNIVKSFFFHDQMYLFGFSQNPGEHVI